MQSIERFVVDQLAAWEVPGCAVAAVQDGRVVLAAGWGQRDLDTKLPVTADTLFAIGSTTKAFTAATVGALVDDGLLDWERPLRDYVPEIQLHDPVVSDRLTVVDLLSHRSGLPRHEMAWLGHPGRSRAELVRRLRFLPLSKDLRQAFQYCNLGYLVAGYAVAVLSGTPWEDYVRHQASGPAGDDQVEPVGRPDERRPGSSHGLRAPPGRRRARAARPVTALARPARSTRAPPTWHGGCWPSSATGRLDGRAVMSPDTVARASRLRHAHHHPRRRHSPAAPGHAGHQPGSPPLRDVRPRVA